MQNNGKLICPEFPDDLSLGKLKYGGGLILQSLMLDYNEELNILNILITGKVMPQIYENGVSLWQNKTHEFHIHKSQLISLEELRTEEIVANEKSVLKRAIVGGVLLGGIGAVVGSLTALNKTNRIERKYVFIINYWDIETKIPNTIILNSDFTNKKYIDKVNKDILNIG